MLGLIMRDIFIWGSVRLLINVQSVDAESNQMFMSLTSGFSAFIGVNVDTLRRLGEQSNGVNFKPLCPLA